ncbi:MAG TPA: hypothetical protein VF665_24385 [Longimicrobium sp.]
MTTLFEAGWTRLAKVRAVLVISLISGAALMFAGWETLHHYGEHPSEGGVLAPLATRLPLGGGMLAGGVLICIGILAYVQACYVARLEQTDGGDLVFTTAGILRPSRVTLAAASLAPVGYNDGEYSAGGLTVTAGWYHVRVPGRRMPLIVDEQGIFPEPERFRAVLSVPHGHPGTFPTGGGAPRRRRRG